MDYEVYKYTDKEKSHYFLSEVTGDKRRAYALAKKPDKYFVFQGNYRLPSDNIKKAMTMKQTEETTMSPFMKQFNELKTKHPDALLLLRVGDFYEAYDEDAVKAGEILGITVTRKFNSKDKGSDGHALKMAGFPHHALDTYLPKLIRAGVRVGICDQLDSKVTKEYPSDEKESKPETDETKVQEKSKPSEDIETLKAEYEKEMRSLRLNIRDLEDKLEEQETYNNTTVRRIISESIKALKGEIPSTLAGYFYNSLGKLEVIKIKNNLSYRLTTDEINFLISEASKSHNQ